MKSGKLKGRKIKLIYKSYDENYRKLPTQYHYAEAGETVLWDGESSNVGHEGSYGGRTLLWCHLETGESIGLEESEVEWDEVLD